MNRLYQRFRPILWRIDAEHAHNLAIWLLRMGLVPGPGPADADTELKTSIAGIDFPNPVGLAAGFDKNAAALRPLFHLGFGFLEVGTLTPRPQKGQKRPRLFRLDYADAIINRMGFNNVGVEKARKKLAPPRGGIVGVNIGANRDSEDKIADYITAYHAVADIADYVTINISSPNTPGLRDLQDKSYLDALLEQLNAEKNKTASKPIFLKIAPDMGEGALEDIIETALTHQIDGLILSNTTVSRPAGLGDMGHETGGLSGAPIFDMTTNQLRRAAGLVKGQMALIGVGGILDAQSAYAKICAGANLVELYSGLIFRGPDLPRQICEGLKVLLDRDGYKNISEAVGRDL